ncbi:MAG: hypothetical protein ACE5SW_13115 [Nitrososphaeraceae archaeon]
MGNSDTRTRSKKKSTILVRRKDILLKQHSEQKEVILRNINQNIITIN